MLPTGTVTFLFTDVVGSTRLWAADEAAMSASLAVHDEVVRKAAAEQDGYVFATAGDSFAVAFARASDAVRVASVVQARLTSVEWPGPRLEVRVGLHLGEAEERDGDYFGPAVNIAARVSAAAHGGQVLMTDPVRATAGRLDVLDLGVQLLRDVPDPLRLFQLGGEAFPPLRTRVLSRSNLPARPTRLIGRDEELSRCRDLLTEDRLVTLSGIGGAGKTCLAIAVGEAELSRRRDGVWFCDLTAVVKGSDVPGAIAHAIGVNL